MRIDDLVARKRKVHRIGELLKQLLVAVTFWSVALNGNTFQGTVKVTVDGTWHGDAISGTYAFSVLDPAGSGTVIFSGTGSFTGTRIVAGQ